jgi:hypothetical protein
MRFFRKHLETAVVAAVTAFVVAAGPAVATTIVDVARNALHLGGKAPSAYVLKTQLPLKFHKLTMINGWVGNCFGVGPAKIALGKDGVVHFQGGICRTSGFDLVPFVIPTAYRPKVAKYFPVDEFNGATGSLHINPDGHVVVSDDLSYSGASAMFTSLEGVEYSRSS